MPVLSTTQCLDESTKLRMLESADECDVSPKIGCRRCRSQDKPAQTSQLVEPLVRQQPAKRWSLRCDFHERCLTSEACIHVTWNMLPEMQFENVTQLPCRDRD